MNRNIVVGGVVFGLIMAALSVGVSTFLVDRNVQAAKLEMKQAVSAQAGSGAATTPDAATPGADAPVSTVGYVPADSGQANNFSASGFMWSKGQLLVTDPAEDTKYIFSVDSTDGARVYGESGLTVDRVLTVNSQSLMGDIDSSGRIKVAGLVTAGSFSNAGGYTVGTDGAVAASRLTVSGLSSLDGGVQMKGNLVLGAASLFSIGPDIKDHPRVAWNPTANGGKGEFVVVGSISASEIRGNNGALVVGDIVTDSVMTGNLTATSMSLASGNGTWTADGVLTTKSIIADSISYDAGKFTVGGGKAKLDGRLDVLGDISVKNLTASEDVTADKALSAANGKFRVDAAGGIVSSGTAQFNGNMDVNGALTATTIDGEFIGTIASTGSMSKSNITASSNLRVGSSSNYVFEVDNSGNVAADGDLTVAGAADITGNITVGGTASITGKTTLGGDASVAGDLSVTGTVSGSNIPNVIRGGTATITGAPETVNVSGMPATASVVVTARSAGPNAASADVSAGSFVLDGDNGSYSWIAVW